MQRLDLAGERAEEGSLAGAVGANEGDAVASLDDQVAGVHLERSCVADLESFRAHHDVAAAIGLEAELEVAASRWRFDPLETIEPRLAALGFAGALSGTIAPDESFFPGDKLSLLLRFPA